MTSLQHLNQVQEYSLERVPDTQSKNGLLQVWIVKGCASTTVKIFLGKFLSFTAGIVIIIAACLFADFPLAALIG